MPLRPFCDDCESELYKKPHIAIPHLVLAQSDGNQREAKTLFFCGDNGCKCLTSFIVKNTNRPTILGPNG